MFLWLTSPAEAYGPNGIVLNTEGFYDVSGMVDNARTFIPHSPGVINPFSVRVPKTGLFDLPIIVDPRTSRMFQIAPNILSPSGKIMVLDALGQEREVAALAIEKSGPLLTDVQGLPIKGPRALLESPNNQKETPRFILNMRRYKTVDSSLLVQRIALNGHTVFLDPLGIFHPLEQGQADSQVLMAQNGSLVYYSMTVNNILMYYRSKLGNVVPADAKFPTSRPELNSILAYAAEHDRNPVTDPDVLAMEIKCAWIEAKDLPDKEKFIRTRAQIPTYNRTGNTWTPTGKREAELALVGMHVVGTVNGHPEMIWATFEHVSNSPIFDYSYLSASGAHQVVRHNTAGKWIFCQDGWPGPYNESNMSMRGGAIVANNGRPMAPSNVMRMFAWGSEPDNGIANGEVLSINQRVRALLDDKDVRKNYVLTGATWTIRGSDPAGPGNQVGTIKLANTTMETFARGMTCFNCHQSNTTAVSRIFNDIKPNF